MTTVVTAARRGVLGRYLAAATGARLADEGARVAVVLLVLERTGRPEVGGLLVAALMVPHVVAAPVAGAAADTARRRRPLYLAAFGVYALSLTGAAVLVGRLTAVAAGLLVVAGCLAPLLLGGLSSLLPELVPEGLARAFALDATTYGVAGIAGPAVAAAIASLAGAGWAMVALGGFAVLGAVMFGSLPLPARAPASGRPSAGTLLAGLGVMVRRPRLGAVTVASGLNQLGFGALPLAAAAIAAEAHRTALTGALMAVLAAGSLLGSLVCTRLPVVQRHPETVLLACITAMAVPLLVAAVARPAVPWLLGLFALAGLVSAPTLVTLFAVRDREAPPGLRTQVFTLGAGIKVTAAAAGAAAGGLLVSHGSAGLLAGAAGCQVLGAFTGAVLLRRTAGGPGTVRAGAGATAGTHRPGRRAPRDSALPVPPDGVPEP